MQTSSGVSMYMIHAVISELYFSLVFQL